MKNLVRIITVAFVTLFLVHCGEDSDLSGKSSGALETIGCNDLNGPYEADVDIVWDFDLWFPDSDYDVNIASSSNDVLVQIKEIEGENVLCAQFSDVERTSPTEASISSESIMIRAGKDNHKDFADGVSSISFKEVANLAKKKDGSKSCIADRLIVKKEGETSQSVKLTRKTTKEKAKSFSVLKRECNTLQEVVQKKKVQEKSS